MTSPLLVEAPPADSGGSGSYGVELLDASGTPVFALDFEPNQLLHAPEGTGEFALLLPVVSGVFQIRLLRGDTPVLTVSGVSSLAAPSFLADSIPTEAPATGEAKIAWTQAADALTYALEVGPDADGVWVTLAITDSSSVVIDLGSLPQDCSCRFRLQASDGVNVAVTESKTFHTSPRAPQVAILSPAPGYLRPGVAVRLSGTLIGETASDAALEWLVDDAFVASGDAADIPPLTDGRHHLVLRVTQGGLSAEAAIDVEVAADSDGDGLPDEWERTYGLDPADPQDAALDSDGDNLPNWRELIYGTKPDNQDSDGDNYADDIEIAGGGDPNDANSIPHAIHGVEGLPIPKLASKGWAFSIWWWVYLLIGAGIAGTILAGQWLWRERRPPSKATTGPVDNTDDRSDT